MSLYIKSIFTKLDLDYPQPVRDIFQYEHLTLGDLEYMCIYLCQNYEFVARENFCQILAEICRHKLVNMEWLINCSISLGYCETLYSNPNISLETIEKYPDFDWDWYYVSKIKDLSKDFVLTHIDEDWNWNELSKHKNIGLEFVLNKFPDWKPELEPELEPEQDNDIVFNETIRSFQEKQYLDPREIDEDLLYDVPITLINKKVATFYNKIETEIALVINTKINSGKYTDCGIRQLVRQCL